jgi:hypothetical protein
MTTSADRCNAHQKIRELFSKKTSGFLLQIKIELSFSFIEKRTRWEILPKLTGDFKTANVNTGSNENALRNDE